MDHKKSNEQLDGPNNDPLILSLASILLLMATGFVFYTYLMPEWE